MFPSLSSFVLHLINMSPKVANCRAASVALSWLHGGHQVAQKWIRVTGAMRLPRVTGRPPLSTSMPAGAAVPLAFVAPTVMAEGELPAGALSDGAEISAPAVSRHLKVLRAAGVVQLRVEGTYRLYRVDPESVRAISGWTISRRAFWEAGLDRLQAALEAEKGD